VTPRMSISSNRIGVDDVWEYYETMRAAIVQFAEAAKQSLIEGSDLRDPMLFGMNLAELDAYFENLLDEADKQACLFLIASAEAAIRVDFLERVYEKRKDRVSRAFRDIYKSRCEHDKTRVRLDRDILETWASEITRAKTAVGTFKGALKFRHWLAHGRYWVPKLGRKYDPIGIVQIVMDLFGVIGLSISE
jgi:hypothetical protein